MAQSTVSLLMNLPMEIHLLILENADYASKVSLNQTNHYFRSLVNVKPPGDAAQQVAFLKGYEQWPENADRHACFKCRMMLAHDEFVDGQKTGRPAKNGKEAETRFCIRCGLLKRLFNPMEPVSIRGKIYYRCASCQGLQGWGSRCHWCCKCSKCLVFRKFEVIEWNRCPECGRRRGIRAVGAEGIGPAQTQNAQGNAGEATSTQSLEDGFASMLI